LTSARKAKLKLDLQKVQKNVNQSNLLYGKFKWRKSAETSMSPIKKKPLTPRDLSPVNNESVTPRGNSKMNGLGKG
jgi:hypothetical protein